MFPKAPVAKQTPRNYHPDEIAQGEQDVQEVDGLVNLHPIWDTDRPPRRSTCVSAPGWTYARVLCFGRQEGVEDELQALWSLGGGESLGVRFMDLPSATSSYHHTYLRRLLESLAM